MIARAEPVHDPQGVERPSACGRMTRRGSCHPIPLRRSWARRRAFRAVKSAFASVLFEPPPAGPTPTADADTTVIERVTAATCLVRVMAPAQ